MKGVFIACLFLCGCKVGSPVVEVWEKIPEARLHKLLDGNVCKEFLPENTEVTDGWELGRTGGVSNRKRIIAYAFKASSSGGAVFDSTTDKEGALRALGISFSSVANDVFGLVPNPEWRLAFVTSSEAHGVIVNPVGAETMFIALNLENIR